MRSAAQQVWQRAQTGHLETWVGYVDKVARRSSEREAIWRAILAEVEARVPIRPDERILDIGCGLDTVFDFLACRRGVTLDSLMARLHPFGLTDAAHHTAGLFEALPFRDKSFDRVFLMNVLDHVLDPGHGLSELARILAPGGVLMISVDTYAGSKLIEKRLHKWWARARGARTKHPWVFSVATVQAALRRSGLEPSEPFRVTGLTGTKERRAFFTATPAG